MNLQAIDFLWVSSKCSLSSINEDIMASISILKSLWKDRKMLLTLNKTTDFFTQSTIKPCGSACEKCRCIVVDVVKNLEGVGLDQVFFDLVRERQQLRKSLKNQ